MTVEEDLAELRATVRHPKDRQDIHDCVVRESRARDRHDIDQINGCWWPEGVDEHGAIICKAPDYAERANFGHSMNFSLTSHNITNHLCEIDDDTAYCESYVIGALNWLDGKTTTIAIGRYIDQLERREGMWRILTRRCTIEATADADGTWIHSKNVKGFLKGLCNEADPSYERPIQWKPKEEGVRW